MKKANAKKKKKLKKAARTAALGAGLGESALGSMVGTKVRDPKEAESRMAAIRAVYSGEGLFKDEPDAEERCKEVEREMASDPEGYRRRMLAKVPAGAENDWLRESILSQDMSGAPSPAEDMRARVSAQRKAPRRCGLETCEQPDTNAAMQRCGRCGAEWYCGARCQRAHWKEHKPLCKAFAACRELPLEPKSLAHQDESGGWKVGHTNCDGGSFVWVLVKTELMGPDANRHGLLAQRSCPLSFPTYTEAALVLCDAMRCPQVDALSCALPRRPICVTLDDSLPPSVQKKLAVVARSLGVVKVISSAIAAPGDGLAKALHREASDFLDCWARIEVLGRPLQLGEDSLFGSLVAPARRRRRGPSAYHVSFAGAPPAPSERVLSAADEEYAKDEHRGLSVKKLLKLPQQRSGISHAEMWKLQDDEATDLFALMHHLGVIFVAQIGGSKRGTRFNARRVRLDANGRPASREVVVSTAFAAMAAPNPPFKPMRPVSIMIAHPSLCSLVDVKYYEDQFRPLKIGVKMGGYMYFEELAQKIYEGEDMQAWMRRNNVLD